MFFRWLPFHLARFLQLGISCAPKQQTYALAQEVSKDWSTTSDDLVRSQGGTHDGSVRCKAQEWEDFGNLGGCQNKLAYGCADPRLHIRARESVTHFTNIATERHQEDFETLHSLINDYIEEHHEIPFVIVLQLLAMRYLGAGLLQNENLDHVYPHRSTKSLSCMFWNLGNWNRKAHSKCPFPEHLEKFRPHIKFNLDTEHRPIGG